MKNLKFSNTSKQLPKTKPGLGTGELNLALAQATECGNGINPKKGYIVLPSFNTISGDKDERYGLYIVDGSIVVEPIADVISAINAFCTNTIVSATGATITGCLVGTPIDGTYEETRQLTATVLPTGAVQTGTWTSSAPLIASVSSTGLVTSGAIGSTTITFTSTDGGFTATCVITVIES